MKHPMNPLPLPPPLLASVRHRIDSRLSLVLGSPTSRVEWTDGEPPTGKADLLTACAAVSDGPALASWLRFAFSTLNEGGLFLGAVLGDASFPELKTCLTEADDALFGGASARLPPWPQPPVVARAMTSCGFALPVVDTESVALLYDTPFDLMRDLCGLAQAQRTKPVSLLKKTASFYAARHAAKDSGIMATAEIVFLHGRKEKERPTCRALQSPTFL